MIDEAAIKGEVVMHNALSRRQFVLPAFVTAAVIIVDQFSKAWALRSLSETELRHVIWTLHFGLRYNSGMAFSQGQGKGPFIALAAVVVVFALAWSLRSKRSVLGVIAVGLVMGGALGNVADRLFRAKDGLMSGHVIDFIDYFRWWPAFNVADMAVVVGAFLLLLESWRHGRQPKSAT